MFECNFSKRDTHCMSVRVRESVFTYEHTVALYRYV